MLLGAHVSIAGGLNQAIARGEAIGANCIQTFASSPRTLAFNPIDETTIQAYREAKQRSSIELHVFHGIYLVNLASEKPDYVNVSLDSLIHYQQVAAQIGALGTIFHVGSHKGAGFDQVKQQIGQAVAAVANASPAGTKLMIENAAGQAGTVGQSVDELAAVFEAAEKAGADRAKLGLCLDTQHAFASGIDARDKQALDAYLAEVETKIGLELLQVIHTNDSKTAAASHKDRHENIGEGLLGNSGISHWLHHDKLQHLPFILEVPGIDGGGPGKKDLDQLKALV